eukprot:CAMPEP_0196578958 /NCGR_PEP_ID=MMETSP1081-20130531/13597_1 /TAXON_ID=36882 /ORGANISM="Pyramimonas amylifera, Strain CCMP720" /LENGTH=411 /DNA_ID=CAMNT_0041898367 /DNA_START=60 /DNA_END=1293 /DNA_ORIENTATION=+
MISTTANTTVAQWKGNCTPFPCRVIKSTSYPKQVVKCEASKNANENSVASAKFSAALFGFLSLPSLARAVELSDKPLQDLVNAVDLVGNSADNAAVDFGKYSASALGQTRALVDSAKPFVEQTGKTLQPLGKAALEFGTPLANDALSKGGRAASDALGSLEAQLGSKGVDVTPFKSVAQTVISEAPKAAKASQPFFESFIQFLTTTEPATLAEYGVILYAIYLITPFAFRFISASQRGYADNLRPAQALDFILKDSNAVIVDLRIESEVNSKGLLDLPQSARSQLTIMERPVLTKGKFTKTAATESEMAAVMLSAMKTVKQNQPVILLDQAGRQSKSVAKELTKKGYSQVYALEGGFEGWVKAQLKIRAAYNVSVVGEPATLADSNSVLEAKEAEETDPSTGEEIQRSLKW